MSVNTKDGLKRAVNNLDEETIKEIKHSLYLDRKDKGFFDVIQERLISRKLLVFLTATALLWLAGLDSDTWGMVAMMYIGGQSAIDFAKVWRN